MKYFNLFVAGMCFDGALRELVHKNDAEWYLILYTLFVLNVLGFVYNYKMEKK